MIDLCYNPSDEELKSLLSRSMSDDTEVKEIVKEILSTVQQDGDKALFAYEKKFDGVDLSTLVVSQEEREEAKQRVSEELKEAIQMASHNIQTFHAAQLAQGENVSPLEGIELSRKIVPIHTVGLYIPGGTAPLFSTVLMLAIPAKVAGCKKIVLTTPPSSTGKIHPALIYAADYAGVDTIYKCGGAQAIAALAYGTKTIEPVDKIFGPGNRFVTNAKMMVSDTVSIDMPAGPSEVMVVANPQSNPAYVASDFLSQSEHGKDSQSMLVIIADEIQGRAYMKKVEAAIKEQLDHLPRHEYLLPSLSHSHVIIAPTLIRAADIVNKYAPEHLVVNLEVPEMLSDLVENAGSIFLGPWSCESAGDYASGTNHTLPTMGWAKSNSGVSTDSFIKKITIQKLSRKGLSNLAQTITTMAEGENLTAHANAVYVRLEEAKK